MSETRGSGAGSGDIGLETFAGGRSAAPTARTVIDEGPPSGESPGAAALEDAISGTRTVIDEGPSLPGGAAAAPGGAASAGSLRTVIDEPPGPAPGGAEARTTRGAPRTVIDGDVVAAQTGYAPTLTPGDVASPGGASPGTGPAGSSLAEGLGETEHAGSSPALHGDDAPFKAGDRLLQYELIRRLGRGGMGQVFLARDLRLGRKVAIKFLNARSGRLGERFLREARATARCSHENIVVIHEVDEADGWPFMVLEHLDGEPLSRLLGRPLPAERAVDLMIPVVRALVRAHAFGIVHRDLKPDNIMVLRSGGIKVLDFGIARLFNEEETFGGPAPEKALASLGGAAGFTREGAILGTMLYMSPEQWGVGEVDHRTDLWAVGLVLHELVSGRHPLAGRTPNELLAFAALTVEPIPSVGHRVPDLPGELERIIDRCLAKRPEERFESAEALLEALLPLASRPYGAELRTDEAPFPGLSAFQEADAGRFFGRDREVTRFVTRLRELPLMAVVGPSGAGKSSFVRAGIAPALKGSGEPWEVITVRPGRIPLQALASALHPLTRSQADGDEASSPEPQAIRERLRAEPGYLGAVLRARARRKQSSVLLFVDQFEELYTLGPDAAERAAFTACLVGMADDVAAPLRVVLSMRSDFLDRVAEDPRLLEDLTRGLFLLQPMDRDGLRQALVRPLELVGFRFETTALVDQMLDELAATRGALPLLQFTAARLWEVRDRVARIIGADRFQELGGIAGALSTHADQVIAGLSTADRQIARGILTRLVTGDSTRAIVEIAELAEELSAGADVERIVDYLVRARLLTVQGGEQEAAGGAVELVHESLIDRWPTLRRWLEEGQEDAAFLAELRQAARQWESRKRSEDLLWRGEAVADARRWRARFTGELPGLSAAFLEQSFAVASRAARRRRLGWMAAFVALLALAGGALVAVAFVRRAELNARDQADAARRAEREVKRQLELVQRKERERAEAESAARTARAEAESGQRKLATTQDKLKLSYSQLERALKEAQQERAKADEARLRAERAKAEALKAAAEARQNAEQVRKLAEAERKLRERAEHLSRLREAQLREERAKRSRITTELRK